MNQIFIPRYVSISPSMWIFFMGNSCLVASRETAKLLYCSLNCSQTGTRGASTSIWKRHMMSQHFFKSSHFVSTDMPQYRKIIYKKPKYPSATSGDREIQEVCGTILLSCCLIGFPLPPQNAGVNTSFPVTVAQRYWWHSRQSVIFDTLTVVNSVFSKRQKSCLIFAMQNLLKANIGSVLKMNY